MMLMTKEWVQKAEGDYGVVSLLVKSRKAWRYDGICFHAQQCAEKYLKARLTEASIVFPKTHDIPDLLQMVLPVEPTWFVLIPEAKTLNRWSVQPRYPGNSPAPAEAREAVKAARKFRAAGRKAFGLAL